MRRRGFPCRRRLRSSEGGHGATAGAQFRPPGPPLAGAAITRGVNDGVERTLADACDRELEELAALLASEDAREGVTAHTEKRAPRYSGS